MTKILVLRPEIPSDECLLMIFEIHSPYGLLQVIQLFLEVLLENEY